MYQRNIVSNDEWDGAYVVDILEDGRPVVTPEAQAEFPITGKERWKPLRELKTLRDGELAGRYQGKITVHGPNSHERDLVVRELRRLGGRMENLAPRIDRAFPVRIRTYDSFEFDTIHRRLLYKIAFGSLACVLGSKFVFSSRFDRIRQFILCGQLISKGNPEMSFIHSEEGDDEIRGLATEHQIELYWTNRRGAYADLAARIALFGFVEYRLTLAWCMPDPDPTTAFVRQFDLVERTVKTVRGAAS